MQLAQDAQHAVENHGMLHRGGVAAIHVSAAPDDHFGALAEFADVAVSGIAQRVRRIAQREKVIRLCAVHRSRHYAIERRIERGQVPQESAAFAIRAVIGLRPSVEESLRFPTRGRVRNGIPLVQNVLPVTASVARAGKDTRQTNDRDVVACGQTQEVLPTADTRSGWSAVADHGPSPTITSGQVSPVSMASRTTRTPASQSIIWTPLTRN